MSIHVVNLQVIGQNAYIYQRGRGNFVTKFKTTVHVPLNLGNNSIFGDIMHLSSTR